MAMPFDDSFSRRAAEFDSYRRELVLHSRTVSGERREEWLQRLTTLVRALFPDAEAHVRKPGLATRLFSVEVSLPHQDKMHLLDLAAELDDNWRATLRDAVKGGASCVYRDRLDAVWEWVVDLGDCYVTGHIKLRNFNFERREDAGRPERTRSYDRPKNRDFGGPPKRKYGDDNRDRDRDRGRDWKRDDHQGDFRDGSRPPRPRRSTYDSPGDSSDGAPKSPKRGFSPKPERKSYKGSGGGYPKFGSTKKGPFRPKRKS